MQGHRRHLPLGGFLRPTLFFAGGEPCWGGPERTVRVTLKCGGAGLTNAREDGKCTYAFDLEHPLACTPEMLPPGGPGGAD